MENKVYCRYCRWFPSKVLSETLKGLSDNICHHPSMVGDWYDKETDCGVDKYEKIAWGINANNDCKLYEYENPHI